MACKLAIVYSDRLLNYDFGPAHPLKPVRLRLAFELMRSVGLLDRPNVMVHEPAQASEEEILLFHEKDYVELVKAMDKAGHGFLDYGDTPAFKGVYEASALVVGATLKAVDMVIEGASDHAMNFSGGLHHAHPHAASGFCVFNDPAIAIAYLKRRGLKRIAYVDIDAHHGDGVMYGFYSDPSVLDIDFHEDGRYLFPGTGFAYETGEGEARGLKVNFPLPPGTVDDLYVQAFNEIVPPLIRAYKPEFIVMQCGADAHTGDPLTHLDLTTKSYGEAIKAVHGLSHEVCEGRMVALGGGGYRPANVARVWALIACVLAGVEPPKELPETWRQLHSDLVGPWTPKAFQSESEAPSLKRRLGDTFSSIITDLKERIPLLKSAPHGWREA